MPLLTTTLSAQLQIIANAHPANEPAAISDWATAFDTYMAASASNGAPLNPAIAALAKTAMISAMTGLSTTGAVAVQAGVAAYWGALAVPLAYGASTSTVPPPALATLSAALTPAFAANTAGSLAIPASCDAIAAAWHPLMLGGTAVFIVPPPTPFPIL